MYAEILETGAAALLFAVVMCSTPCELWFATNAASSRSPPGPPPHMCLCVRFVYSGEAITVAFVLAIVPYLIIRGPVSRIASKETIAPQK
jgi:hypothetical protein